MLFSHTNIHFFIYMLSFMFRISYDYTYYLLVFLW